MKLACVRMYVVLVSFSAVCHTTAITGLEYTLQRRCIVLSRSLIVPLAGRVAAACT